MDIVCVGDCGIDRYLPSNKTCVGGITANFARNARQQFPEDDIISVVSCVGTDRSADLILSTLSKSGIECHISKLAGSTSLQEIRVQPNGEKKFVHYNEGVLGRLNFNQAQRQLIETADVVVAPVYQQILGLFDRLMAISPPGATCIDFADFLEHPDFDLLDRYIERIDIAFFGLTLDDISIIDRLAKRARDRDKLIVITLGGDGSRAFQGSQKFECPAISVNRVVDTTGAGDAYAAGFMSAYSHGVSIDLSMQRGASIAAGNVMHMGAFADNGLSYKQHSH
jgi:sugar/nucleoside kinase (ribokinase family)